MIDLYTWTTTNGRRAIIMAEEAGLPYNLNWINIQKGDQKTPQYEKINPYRKIPSMIDSDGPGGKPATLFESVAICFYLAQKAGKLLGSPVENPNVLKWSMFHATNVLWTIGSLGRINDPSIESGSKNQLATMDKHLASNEYFAGSFSIADIIPFTRLNGIKHESINMADYPNVVKWLARVGARPGVKKGMEVKPPAA